MLYLYLDESGDLGFDFVNKSPSKFFTICVLAIREKSGKKRLEKMVRRTLRVKINRKNKRKRLAQEIKATSVDINTKRYLYRQIKKINFRIYALTLNKKRVYQNLTENKPRVYNWVARLLLDQIDFDDASQQIVFTLDRCKNKKQISEFNQYIETQLQAKIPLNIPLNIHHEDSRVRRCLNLADLFSWGIFRKYERKDFDWYQLFKEKIKYDSLYLP